MAPQARTIVIGVTLSLLFSFRASSQSQTPEKPAAVVNGETISRAEFELVFQHVPKPMVTLTEAQQKALKMELLGLMIDEMLLQQFLKKNVPAPEAAVVQKRINELEAAQKAKGRTLQDYYKESGQSDAKLRADITAAIQWNAYVKKKFTEAELKKHYDENKELFDGVLLRASHIAVKVPPASDVKTKDAAKARLQSLRHEIIGRGLDFSEAAKKHSQDPTAPNGGDLGYFPPRGDPAEFIRAAASLKVGQVSDVVQTEYGYHIVKLTERKPGKPTTFDEVKDEVRVFYAEEFRQKLLADLRNAAKLEIHLP
jgi:parvulin-like peptidyl-prolyl isomerase